MRARENQNSFATPRFVFKPERALTAEPPARSRRPGSQGKNIDHIHPVRSHLLRLTSEENSLRQSVRSQVQQILAQTVDDSAAAARESIVKKKIK